MKYSKQFCYGEINISFNLIKIEENQFCFYIKDIISDRLTPVAFTPIKKIRVKNILHLNENYAFVAFEFENKKLLDY
jgi:hypothetical protein